MCSNIDLLTVNIGFIAILVILKLTELYLRTIYLQDLQNKCVLVTGCDSGFSHLLAQELDKRGVRVFAGCLTGDGQTTLTKKCSSNASFFVLTSRKRIRFETLFTWSSQVENDKQPRRVQGRTVLWMLKNASCVLIMHTSSFSVVKVVLMVFKWIHRCP